MHKTHHIKIRTMQIVLLAGFALMCIKFFAWYLTHSNAILTDAIESIVNIVAGSFALYSVYYAAAPKDKNHPYGHGKIEFLSAGFEGGMIIIAGAGMIAKGIVAFVRKEEVHEADAGAYLSAFAGLVNYIMGAYLIRKGKKYQSSLMIADGKHLISDTLSSIGLVAGLLLIYFTGLSWIDSLITLLFGLFIIYTGIRLVKESVTNLLDEADLEKLEQLVKMLNRNRREKWIDIHNLRVLKYGPQLHVDCHLTLPWYDTLEESHKEVSLVEKLVKENMENDMEFFIHADPCLPASCPVCLVSGCPVRRADFAKKITWTVDNLQPDQKHNISTS